MWLCEETKKQDLQSKFFIINFKIRAIADLLRAFSHNEKPSSCMKYCHKCE